MTYAVHEDVHKRLTNLLNEMVEYGGTLKLNRASGTLDLHDWRKGDHYDEIGIPPGPIQWHTHPKSCSATRCTLGIPSGPDLAGFAKAAASGGSLAHLVYSGDGVYAIIMDPSYLQAMKNDSAFVDKFCAATSANFNTISSNYIKDRVDYPAFRDKWLSTANASGFGIKLFPLTRRPALMIDIDSIVV